MWQWSYISIPPPLKWDLSLVITNSQKSMNDRIRFSIWKRIFFFFNKMVTFLHIYNYKSIPLYHSNWCLCYVLSFQFSRYCQEKSSNIMCDVCINGIRMKQSHINVELLIRTSCVMPLITTDVSILQWLPSRKNVHGIAEEICEMTTLTGAARKNSLPLPQGKLPHFIASLDYAFPSFCW